MCTLAPAGVHHLKHGVNCWALALDLNGEDSEEDDLDSSTCQQG